MATSKEEAVSRSGNASTSKQDQCLPLSTQRDNKEENATSSSTREEKH